MIYQTFQERLHLAEVPYPDRKDPQFEEKRRLYQNWQRQVTEEFKSALEVEYGTAKSKKRDLLWDRAWSMGHSSGFHDVESYYSDLAELLD